MAPWSCPPILLWFILSWTMLPWSIGFRTEPAVAGSGEAVAGPPCSSWAMCCSACCPAGNSSPGTRGGLTVAGSGSCAMMRGERINVKKRAGRPEPPRPPRLHRLFLILRVAPPSGYPSYWAFFHFIPTTHFHQAHALVHPYLCLGSWPAVPLFSMVLPISTMPMP